MLKMSTKSKLKPEEVIQRAVKYFGPGGYGLKVEGEGGCCAEFEGGGGGVRVSVAEEKKGSTVDVESREWDFQVREFLDKVK
ncbi:MAG: hypothetical protein A2Y92_03970 [Chloroflexi bacterium RBG_13_57_8]|nr:MAG: hypothetical protein A2Y92_03970 [Chloroflexi bacterium RBG_13_57_8]